jgi:hypothetical protein
MGDFYSTSSQREASMLDFQAVRDGIISLDELIANLTREDLQQLTQEMNDLIKGLIVECEDKDVTFEPIDPEAHDPHAEKEEDIELAWNLGHVIVHITASSEESAFLAAEMARGVLLHGRSRYEIPWQEMTTLKQCHQRLEESRRMRMASLEMWPDEPHLDLTYPAWSGGPVVNAVGRFSLGLMHSHSHIAQIQSIIHQSKTSRLQ